MSEQENNNKRKEFWLYIGNTIDAKQKVCREFEVLTEDLKRTGERKIYGLKQTFAIGGIYSLDVERQTDGRTTILINSIRFEKMFPDTETVQLLHAQNRIFNADLKRTRLEAKYKKGLDIPDSWEEITAIYKKLSSYERYTFEQLVLIKLRTSKFD